MHVISGWVLGSAQIVPVRGGAAAMVKDSSVPKQRPSVACEHLKEFAGIHSKLSRNLVSIHLQLPGLTVVSQC